MPGRNLAHLFKLISLTNCVVIFGASGGVMRSLGKRDVVLAVYGSWVFAWMEGEKRGRIVRATANAGKDQKKREKNEKNLF